MKKHIKYISIIGCTAIFFLQALWFYNTYSLINRDLEEKLNYYFIDAQEKELFLRLASIKPAEGTEIYQDTIKEDGSFNSDNLNLQEAMIKFNAPISIHKIDSIFSKLICEKEIHLEYIINKINPITGAVLETTTSQFKRVLKYAMYSNIIPIRKDNSEGIQAIVISPYKAISDRMITILITSVLIAVIVGYCIVYQIKVIIRQNKIARIRQDFTYAIIHDMKTPLSTIIMGVTALKSKKLDNKPEKIKKYFDICMEESGHLLLLTNRILTIAKLEQDKLTLNKQAINLEEMIKPMIEKFSMKATKKVIFTTSISKDAIYVIADSEYLKEAISNLIDNAIKYSREEVNIDITCVKANNMIKIEIRDDGLGIAPKDQVKIFEKFERAAAVGRKGGATGFGLGLNYVLQVIEAHGGTVTVFSVLDEFSKFTISLPV